MLELKDKFALAAMAALLQRTSNSSPHFADVANSAWQCAEFMMSERQKRMPGWKLVAKRDTRKWADEQEAVAFLSAQAVTPYESKVISPSVAEKLLKKDRPIVPKQVKNLPEGLTVSVLERRNNSDMRTLKLSTRLHYALLSEDLYTIADICCYTEKEILKIPNIGRTQLAHLITALDAVGEKLAAPSEK